MGAVVSADNEEVVAAAATAGNSTVENMAVDTARGILPIRVAETQTFCGDAGSRKRRGKMLRDPPDRDPRSPDRIGGFHR